MTVTHEIPAIYDAQSKILILGSIPSPKSREAGFYYAHPQNAFWRVLPHILGQPSSASNDEKRKFLLDNHIALWDVLQSCDIIGASDSSIRNPIPNDFSPLMAAGGIRAVFTTGKVASTLYVKHCAHTMPPALTHIALPSTSPANCRYSFHDLVEAYKCILNYL